MAAITEDLSQNMELKIPNFEIVKFVTASSGDIYDSKKFGTITGAWASQQTTDSEEIRCSISTLGNGQQRVTLNMSASLTGWLIITGRK